MWTILCVYSKHSHERDRICEHRKPRRGKEDCLLWTCLVSVSLQSIFMRIKQVLAVSLCRDVISFTLSVKNWQSQSSGQWLSVCKAEFSPAYCMLLLCFVCVSLLCVMFFYWCIHPPRLHVACVLCLIHVTLFFWTSFVLSFCRVNSHTQTYS